MIFTDLIKTGFKVQGRNKEFVWLPLTLRKYGEFVKWVQYLPYHEAKENNLPKKTQDNILSKCQTGQVIEKTIPDDWPDDKKVKDEDLIEKKFDIHLGSSCVSEMFFTAKGLAKLLQLGLSISYPEMNEIILDQEIDTENQGIAIKEIQDAMMKQEEEIGKNELSPNQN